MSLLLIFVVSLASFSTSSIIFFLVFSGIGIKDLDKSFSNFCLIESIFSSVRFFLAFVFSSFSTSTISALLSSDKASYFSINLDKPTIKKKIMETVR